MSGLRVTERAAREAECSSCGSTFVHVTGFLHDRRGACATYFAACHRHPEPEAQIDVVLGTWGSDESDDHVAFSCRLRRSGAMLVDATIATDSDHSVIGRRLTQDEALAHSWLQRFWAIVDFLAADDASIAQHLDDTSGAAEVPRRSQD